MRTLLAPLGLALCVTGCFRMVNVDPLAAGRDDVRVQLTPAAAERVTRGFGTVGSRLVGHLSQAGPDSLALDVWLGQIFSDAALANSRLVVPLHRTEVVEVQRRELSIRRTVLAGAAGAGMIALLLSRTSLFEANSPDDDGPGPPPPPEAVFHKRGMRFFVSVPLRFGR